jgi:hypothetical protein
MPIFASGTLNVTSLLVPDLYIQIVPPSQLSLNGIPSNMVGLVGTAQWGPVSVPVSVASMQAFALSFGSIQNRTYDMGTHAAVITQQGGNNMTCVRVTDGTDTAATAAVATNITFNGKYTGTFGNQVSVTIQPGAGAGSWRAIIGAPGFLPEVFDNLGATVSGVVHPAVSASATVVLNSSVSGIVPGMLVSGTGVTGTPTVSSVTNLTTVVLSVPQTLTDLTALTFVSSNAQIWAAMAAAINTGQNTLRGASNYVTAVDGIGTTTPTSTQYVLTGGTDGITSITSSVMVGNGTTTGMYALAGSGMAFLDVCDLTDPTQFSTVDGFAVQQSCYAIQAMASGQTATTGATAKQATGVNSYNSKIMLGDWCFWNDPQNQVVRLISPAAFMVGRLSNLSPEQSSLNKPIYGIAGTQKSGFGSLNAFYSTADLNTLELNGIDVITNPGAGQISEWTARFGHNSSTNITVHLDNYTTLTNYVAKTLEGGLGFYIGQVISQQLFGNITATLTQFLQNLTGAGMLVSPDGSVPYGVQCNLANNPPSQTQLGIVQANVQAVFPSILEKFLVNLQGGNTVVVTRVTTNQ